MLINGLKKRLPVAFWVSLLLHLLLFLYLLLTFHYPEQENKKPPTLYVPSYVYRGSMQPTPTIQATKLLKQEAKTALSPQAGDRKIVAETQPIKKIPHKTYSLLASTYQILQQTQMETVRSMKESEPIYLVGDENSVANPLIKLLGQALSANFAYPKAAGEFGIKGKVLVSFVLHPEGYLSDIHIIRSSNDHDLDAAALYAANRAPRIEGANRFITKPKSFVVGFVFH